jgi:hypothetical protein
MKLKGFQFVDVAKIQEAISDELKMVQKKRNFWQLFRKSTTTQRSVYMPMEHTLN